MKQARARTVKGHKGRPARVARLDVVENRNNVLVAGGNAALGRQVSRANRWRQNYNALLGLTLSRARTLVESYTRGEFADLMWTFGAPFQGIESADADLLALIERRRAALQDFTWHARIVDKAKRRGDFDAKLAEEQQVALYEAYDYIDNLDEALDHLALASFRGFAHVQKHRRPDGDIHHLEVLDQWNVVRDGWMGGWKYNPEAIQTSYDALPPDYVMEGPEWILREVQRPINRIALQKFIRQSLADKDWDAFLEIYGIPSGVVIGPPEVPKDNEAEFRDAAESVSQGGSGYLPHGSDYKANDGPRGVNPFRDRLDYLSEKLVLAGTGGMLTMLSKPTGIGQGATGAHEEAFRQIAKAEAKSISAVLQRMIDAEVLGKSFPGRPALAYFEIAADEETDPGDAVGHVVSLAGAGYMTDAAQVQELTRYQVTLPPQPGIARPASQPAPLGNRASQPARSEFAESVRKDLTPLAERVARLLGLHGEEFDREVRLLRRDLPALVEEMNADPASAEILTELLGDEFLEGLES
jgi:phage gp29-like protein